MIKQIKIGNLIYKNIEPFYVNEKGKRIWNIPNDLEELRKAVIDTINWKVGDEVKKATGDLVKLSAANSKAIVIVLKLLETLNPDTSKLNDLEKSAYEKMLTLADNGYGDSELLNNSLDAVLNGTTKGQTLIAKALKAETTEELLGILNEL